jgi:hypothetical protein
VPGIGQAIFSDSQGQMLDFAELATNIQELIVPTVTKRLEDELKRKPTDEEVTKEVRRLGRKSVPLGYEPMEVTDKDRNMYLLRVTECELAHVPASLDDKTVKDRKVRDDVATDCRMLAAYEQGVKALQAATAGGDLEAVAKQYESKVQWPKEFTRNAARAPVDVQFIHDFVKTAFTLPEPGPGKPPSVTVLGDEPVLKAFALKLEQILPTSGADFRDERAALYQDPGAAVVGFEQGYLKIEELSGRLKFKPAHDFVKRSTTP